MKVAIVGGGASGVLCAHALEAAGLDVVLADPNPGRGLAYGGRQPAHLLNTRASAMALDEARPDHFADWLDRKRPLDRAWSRHDFAPRQVYGDYLEARLGQLAALGSVRLVRERVTRVARAEAGWRLSTADGETFGADAVVLATGNPQPRPLAFPGRIALAPTVTIDDPWEEAALAAVPAAGAVLLVGTGLTAVDVAVSLLGRPAGPSVVAASRRGLLPRIHDVPRPALALEPPFPTTARGLYRRVRDLAEQVAGGDPYARQAIFQGLKPVVPRIWAGLPLAEKRRFMRHLKPWWDVERHRLAPEVAAVLAEGEAHGRFEAPRGRIVQARPTPHGARVTLVSGRERRHVDVTRIVNCTGPDWSVAERGDPLIASVAAAGALPDDMGLGLAVDDWCRTLGRRGPVDGLYALGPLTRGTFFEITAVPEIRAKAAKIAQHLSAARSLQSEGGERRSAAAAR